MLQLASDHDVRRDLMETAPAYPGSGPSHRTVDLREMAQILRRRRLIVFATTMTFITLAIIFLLFATTLYTATSTVLIDPRRSSVADGSNNQQPTSNFGTDDAAIESQVLLIQSVAVLQRVVDTLHLAQDPEFGPHSGILDSIKKSIFRIPRARARAKCGRCGKRPNRRFFAKTTEGDARGHHVCR